LNRILRASAWLDDGNMVCVEIVAINGEEKVIGAFTFTPEEANNWADKLLHAGLSGLRMSERSAPA